MSEGFAGDPFHEGGSQPLTGLKGGMEQPHTQMPITSEAQNNPRSAGTDNVNQSWDQTSLKNDHPTTGSNDKNKAH